MAHKSLFPDRLSRLCIAVIGGLLAMRVVFVLISPLELYADEAQYWRWGQALDWGYYSKPPMIAWMIQLSTSLFGDSEWAIRILAPVFHAISALFLMLLSRRMFGSLAAVFTVMAYMFMPGIVLSSGVISTDGVLFPFWCVALYLFWRLRENDLPWPGIVVLGVAVGAGVLSKYAMVYFVVGVALTALFDPTTRRAVLSRRGAAMACIAVLVVAPHAIWNALNGFQTVSHTVDNANLGGPLFNLDHLPRFIGDQMGVFGPVSFVALIAGLTLVRPNENLADLGDAPHAQRTKEVWLACFIVPVLLIIAFQAVLSRAHANWAATAYPAASVWIGGFLMRASGWRVPFWSGLIFQGTVGLLASIFALGPPSWSASIGRDNDLKRVRGWQDLSIQLEREVERLQPTAILVDEREIWHGFDYYLKDTNLPPLIMWRYHPGPKSFSEAVDLGDVDHSRVLVASYRSHFRPPIKSDFATWQPEGAISVDLGHRSNGCPLQRELRLYLVTGYAPLERTQAWTQQFKVEDADGNLVDSHIDQPERCAAG